MFKKFIFTVAIVLMAVSAQAEGLLNVENANSTVKFNSLNIQGDVLYLPSSGNFAVGVGTTIATIYDIGEIRGVFVDPLPDDVPNKAGIGVGINVIKAINKVGGVWLLDKMNPSVGVTELTNLSGKAHIEPAIYVSAINWKW